MNNESNISQMKFGFPESAWNAENNYVLKNPEKSLRKSAFIVLRAPPSIGLVVHGNNPQSGKIGFFVLILHLHTKATILNLFL